MEYFGKAKYVKEQYTEQALREKIELEITNLEIETLTTGEEVTIDKVLETLLEKGIFESIEKEGNIGRTGEYEIKFKYDSNNNVIIEYVEQLIGNLIVTYTVEPENYIKEGTMTITLKVAGKVKSITKPDGLIIYPKIEQVGLDYDVTANGTYTFIIEDEDGNKIEKEVIVDKIDNLKPKDFEVTVEDIQEGIIIKTNAADSEKTTESACSGIERLEYFIKKNTDSQYIKYDTNQIKNLDMGTYNIYVIAYDKAGNSNQSDVIEKIIIQESAANYGQRERVNYEANGISDWQIFYKDEQRGETYIITRGYLPNEKIPVGVGMDTYGKYRAYWSSVPNNLGSKSISEEAINRFKLSWATTYNTSTNNNIKYISTLMDTNVWNEFATGKAISAIGSPTLEMFVESWNDYYPNNKLQCNLTNSSGYYIDNGVTCRDLPRENPLYTPHPNGTDDGCKGYWLASPNAWGDNYLCYINDYMGINHGNLVDSNPTKTALRPIVCLPSNSLQYNENTCSWDIK